MKTEDIIAKCMEIIKCDTARISKPIDTMFLIIGFNRNTKDDDSRFIWIDQNNNRIDFDYVQESVVASGKTAKELIANAKEYQRLCGITWEQYFSDLAISIMPMDGKELDILKNTSKRLLLKHKTSLRKK